MPTSAKTILIVEDDLEIARLTSMLLESEGYRCTCVHSGDEAVALIESLMPDLVLLDLMLPGKNGLDVCLEIRGFYAGAVLVLTGQDSDMSELTLLKSGADDYVLKPIKPHLLLARIEVLLKRISQQSTTNEVVTLTNLSVDAGTRKAFYCGKEVNNITTAEFDALWLLAQHAGTVLSREFCCEQLRGIEFDALDRSIDMRISSLRKKLAQVAPEKDLIVTVRNQGYLLIQE